MPKDDTTRPDHEDPAFRPVGNPRQGLVDAVERDGLDIDDLDPADRFVNLGHVGAGTIMPDGTYGAPMPDPMVAKLAAEAQELDTHGADADQDPGIRKAAKAPAPKKATEPTK